MGHGTKLMSAYMARLLLLVEVMYVDDTDPLHTAKSSTACDKELMEQVQGAMTDWTMLGQVTGNCLKPDKCRVYFQTYKFVRGRHR